MQSRISLDLVDSLLASVLLFVALWIAGLIWPGFGEFFGAANSLYFALAYLVARAVAVLLRDLVYGGTARAGAGGRPHTTT
jgi:low affinity Fe/Cu permease